MKKIVLLAIMVLLLSSCNSYSSESAKEKGYVVIGQSQKWNFEKVDEFMKAVENQADSQIKLVGYTDEGDPILQELIYKDGTYKYTFDNSRDKHGGKSKGKSSTQCKDIEIRKQVYMDEIERDEYVLLGCKEIIGIHSSDEDVIILLVN